MLSRDFAYKESEQAEEKCEAYERKETECAKQGWKEVECTETGQGGMKVIVEFSQKTDSREKNTGHEETVRQEIQELLIDMLREHYRKSLVQNSVQSSAENVSGGADVL
ncbi:MAG: hypothetical protein NC314_06370 [Roseburia sp.]|nr:hypothetical protein [Roseburia sp.]MCM1242449.1 hypothetical protein [Roseburia sp.]